MSLKGTTSFFQNYIFRTFVMMQRLKGALGQGISHSNDPLWDLFPMSLSFAVFCLPVPLRRIPRNIDKLAQQRIHDLISLCHSDLIGLDTTSKDLKGLKMFLLHGCVCLVIIGGSNEAQAAGTIEALSSKTTSNLLQL